MAINDNKVAQGAAFAREHLCVTLVTAVSQTDAVVLDFVPGFPFQVVAATLWNKALVGAVTVKVRVGGANLAAGRNPLAADLAASNGARTAGALVTGAGSVAIRRGSAADAIRVSYTSDGTGALTNGILVLVIRPYPASGEVK